MGFKDNLDVGTDIIVHKFRNHEDGMMSTGAIIGLVIGIVILAALMPTAISSINDANTTGWDASQAAIWSILGLIILAVVVMKISE
jgi:phosphohistidine swiveling domain-containing protein